VLARRMPETTRSTPNSGRPCASADAQSGVQPAGTRRSRLPTTRSMPALTFDACLDYGHEVFGIAIVDDDPYPGSATNPTPACGQELIQRVLDPDDLRVVQHDAPDAPPQDGSRAQPAMALPGADPPNNTRTRCSLCRKRVRQLRSAAREFVLASSLLGPRQSPRLVMYSRVPRSARRSRRPQRRLGSQTVTRGPAATVLLVLPAPERIPPRPNLQQALGLGRTSRSTMSSPAADRTEAGWRRGRRSPRSVTWTAVRPRRPSRSPWTVPGRRSTSAARTPASYPTS
jgi:hypothetical protein